MARDTMARASAILFLALGFALTGCGSFNPFNDPPANIEVEEVSYNSTLPESFFRQSMATLRMQFPNADYRSTAPRIPYGDLVYSYIEYKPTPEDKKRDEIMHMHALITDGNRAWRIDETFNVDDRLKYRTRFQAILENIQRARNPAFIRNNF